MTVSVSAPTKFEFVSDASATYSITLRIRSADDILVYAASTLIDAAHYSVSAITETTFTINFSVGEEPADGINCVVFQNIY